MLENFYNKMLRKKKSDKATAMDNLFRMKEQGQLTSICCKYREHVGVQRLGQF